MKKTMDEVVEAVNKPEEHVLPKMNRHQRRALAKIIKTELKKRGKGNRKQNHR